MDRIQPAPAGALLLGALLLTSAATTPDSAAAQIRASERGSVSQTIDGTTIRLDYSRPSARGRTLFGDLVPWDVVWTPGANWATTLEADKDIRLNEVEVPAGTYSVWMIPRQDDWTLTLNRDPELFHFQKPDSTGEQIHVAVQAEEGSHLEMLTWSFPAVAGDGGILQLHWGRTVVPVHVVVQPSDPVALAAAERERFVGTFALSLMEGIGWPTSADLEVFEEGGMLRGRLPFPFHEGDELEFDLIPAGRDRFSPGLYRNGKLFNVEPSTTFEFDVTDGRATAVRMRGVEGSVFGEGERTGG